MYIYHVFFTYFETKGDVPSFSYYSHRSGLYHKYHTLDSGIDRGPTFINLGFFFQARLLLFGIFSRPYGYFKVLLKVFKIVTR